MSEQEREEVREPVRRVEPRVETHAPRGPGRPLDGDLRASFGSRLGGPLDDVRIHTGSRSDTAVARFPSIADKVREAAKRIGGGDATAVKAVQEKAVTPDDARRLNALALVPLMQCVGELSAGESSVPTAKAVLPKLLPIAQGVMVLGGAKQKPENRDVYYAVTDSISDADATLQVMTKEDPSSVWNDQFKVTMNYVDELIALPVQKENDKVDPGSTTAPMTQVDHDLLVASVKPQLQNLMNRVQGKIHEDWNPKEVAADLTASSTMDAVAHRGIIKAKASLRRALAAVKAAGMSLDEQRATAVAKLVTAQAQVVGLTASAAAAEPAAPAPGGNGAAPASGGGG